MWNEYKDVTEPPISCLQNGANSGHISRSLEINELLGGRVAPVYEWAIGRSPSYPLAKRTKALRNPFLGVWAQLHGALLL